MKNFKTWAFIGFLTIFPLENVQAMSLDEIYRDIVRDDNSGYLPIFVRNRNRPELLFEDKLPKEEIKTEKKTRTADSQTH